jgi:hypothetical protein
MGQSKVIIFFIEPFKIIISYAQLNTTTYLGFCNLGLATWLITKFEGSKLVS